MKKKILSAISVILPLAAVIFLMDSCNEIQSEISGPVKTKGGSTSASMSLNVTPVSASEDALTKSASGVEGTVTNVFGSQEEGLYITEYVSDIEDVLPQTKGSEIKTENIASFYGEFKVSAFTDSLYNGAHVKYFADIKDLTSKYDGSSWKWYDGSYISDEDAPKWRINTPTSIWSYAPVSATGRTAPAVDSLHGIFDKMTFTYTVPDNFHDQKDLLFAYNVESREFKKEGTVYKKPYEIDPAIGTGTQHSGQYNEYFDVNFYHALAAVKFELNTSTAGANVHSVTICYTDGSNNIVLNNGLATTGDCTATGSGSGAGAVSFNWQNLGGNKPLRYVYSDAYPATSQTVSGGYAKNGNGVLFMIPQTASNLKVIVEFSKNGGNHYYTAVYDTPLNVNWQAGKYYLYRLSVGEFHVVGEKMTELTDILIAGLKSDQGFFKRPEGDPVPSKGVTKMALITNGYGLEVKTSTGNTSVSMHSNAYGGDNDVPSQVDYINFDLLPYTLDAHSNLTSFGDGTPEQYSKRVYFQLTKNENNKNPTIDTSRAAAYVFETGGKDSFFLYFRPENGSNNGGFRAELKGLFVVEVAPDPNLPGNWDAFLSSFSS